MKKLVCLGCGKTLGYYDFGRFEIKCPRCGVKTRIDTIKDNKVKSIGEHR